MTVKKQEIDRNMPESNTNQTFGGAPPMAMVSESQMRLPQQIHHADATPDTPQPIMEPIQSIAQRLLSLRGSPPGTLASLAENEIKLLCQRVRPILLAQPMLLELEAPLKIC